MDIDKNARKVYENNYNIKPVDDIRNVDEKKMPDFDILCAGFPCQPFSNGGNKKCFNDNRGLLFDEIIRIAKYKTIIDLWYAKYKNILLKREIYGKLEWQTGIIKENESIYNYFIQFRQSGIRVKVNKYFPTLVAISQIPIYGQTKSYITPRECTRLQSFPEDFILDDNDKITYKQLGNSVNVENVYAVIKSTLKKYKKTVK